MPVSGRFSSSKGCFGGLNFQNIPNPKRTKIDPIVEPYNAIRDIIIPDDRHYLVSVDLSQAEARVVAWESGNEEFIYFFEAGLDIHQEVANLISIDRKIAKNLVHAANYLISGKGFADIIGCSKKEADKYLSLYFERFPAIVSWQKGIINLVRSTRTLINPFGRKRYFYGRFSSTFNREAVAQSPQSTVGDYLNTGLVGLYRKGYDILAQIHDEVLLQIKLPIDKNILFDIKQTLEISIEINGRSLVIPANISIGKNWKDLEEINFEE